MVPEPEGLPSVSTFKLGESFIVPFDRPLRMPYKGFSKGGKTFVDVVDSTVVDKVPGKTSYGRVVDWDGKPLPGVAVSDGALVTTTAYTQYEINNFILEPESNRTHRVVAFTDTHLANRTDDVSQFETVFKPDLRAQADKARSEGVPFYGLTLGDDVQHSDNKILVNVFNWNTHYTVSMTEIGVGRLDVKRVEATCSSATSSVLIEVTDEYGNTYSETMTRPRMLYDMSKSDKYKSKWDKYDDIWFYCKTHNR